MPSADSTRIVVFAKEPVPGTVKTRLIPRLGPQGAARLHRELVGCVLATATAARVGAVELCCAPDPDAAFFADCARTYGVALAAQGEGDLGARMARAIGRALATDARVVLIGSDCPVLDRAYLGEADAALRAGAEVVLGPAEDGGYVLVGARRLVPAMFESIEWGGPTVLAVTRARLRSMSVAIRELATLWDLDRPEDVDRYAEWRASTRA